MKTREPLRTKVLHRPVELPGRGQPARGHDGGEGQGGDRRRQREGGPAPDQWMAGVERTQ